MTKRVLFVDSHENWLQFVRRTLTDQGRGEHNYEIHTSQDLGILSRASWIGCSFDLIFVDDALAESCMDILNREVRSDERSRKVVVLSRRTPDGPDARGFFQMGASDVAVKPLDSPSLRVLLKDELEVVDHRRSRAGNACRETDYGAQLRYMTNRLLHTD